MKREKVSFGTTRLVCHRAIKDEGRSIAEESDCLPLSPEETNLGLDSLGDLSVRLDGSELPDRLPSLDDSVVELDNRRKDSKEIGSDLRS